MGTKSPYLIDWLTLRLPVGPELCKALYQRVSDATNKVYCVTPEGEIVWQKGVLDIDALRSDIPGLCWMLQSNGEQEFLSIGASPASLEHQTNVFGSCDIRHGAKLIIERAQYALQCILPPLESWQCRRVDVTGNYVLPDAASVKQALRQLSLADGGRRRATTKARGGDSVYWNPGSDLVKGKAYHKGPQLEMLCKKGRITCPDELLRLTHRILRLEHTRSARWFRRLEEAGRHWYDLTEKQLSEMFIEFFGRITEGVEVYDMERHELVDKIRLSNGITEGRAAAAFTTYRNIRSDGFEVVKDYMPRSSFARHLKYLRGAGISDADLQMGNVVQFRPVRIILAQPVSSWDDLRAKAA